MSEMGDHPRIVPKRPVFSTTGLFVAFAGICALLAVATICAVPWFIATKGGDVTDHVIRAFGRVLQLTPTVTIKGDSVVLEKSAINELAVVQRKTQVLMKYETQWLGSTKILIVRGDFIAKAGFDLNQSFRFNIQQPSNEVTVDLPKPKILSVAFQNYEVMFSNDGVINKLQTEDQARVIQQMLAKANADAESSDMKQEAMQQVEQRLKDLLIDSATKVTVVFHNDSPQHTPTP
jgi:hypothetical protein